VARTLPRLIRILVIAGITSALWLVYEWLNLMYAHTVLHSGTAEEAIVFMPGKGFLVLYSGLALFLLIPPLIIGASVLFPDGHAAPTAEVSSAVKPRSRWTAYCLTGFALLGICLSAAIAGYAFEASRTVARISHQSLAYSTGSYKAEIPLREIRRLELRWKARNKQVEIISKAQNAFIDLGVFAPRDQELFLRVLTVYAHLSRVAGHESDVIVWRRLGAPPSITAPD
jgi:hypothetical protein